MSDSQSKPLILLATGSTQRTRLVSKQLQEYFRVMTSEDAEAAWEVLVEHREISLMICDLDLAIDAFGMLERLRNASDSWLAATPVLLLVGENDSDSAREMAFQMGATDFINLPFASAELSARVRLHANLYVQHAQEPTQEITAVSAVNLLQQLSQQNFFNSRVQQEMSFSLRHRTNFSLCKLKLDNIKAIVAGFDKSTAISVVRSVARVIQESLRREDTLCYLGNAEFHILYPATNGIGATSGVRRILNCIEQRKIRIAGKRVPVTLSASVYSCVASEATDSEQIYTQLDQGLKQAMEQGGNRVVSVTAGSEQPSLSIDRALKLIEAGDSEHLEPHAAALLLGVMPLLEFTDQSLQLGLESYYCDLRLHLESVTKTGTD